MTDTLEGVMVLVVILLLIARVVIDSTVLIIMVTPRAPYTLSSSSTEIRWS